MRILFLSPRQPWPLTSGAKLREHYFARALGRTNELTYIHFEEPHCPGPGGHFSFARRRLGIPFPRRYTPAKIVSGLLGRWPLPVVNYSSEEMARALIDLSGERFDLIHIDAVHLVSHTPLLQKHYPGVPLMYDWHNIESELMRRYSLNVASLPRRIYASLTARRLDRMERFILETGAGHVVCSDRERDQLLRIFPSIRVAVVPNGVDTAAFAETARSSEKRDRLVFVGAMRYHANVEAALDFTRHVWPLVHRRFPDWRLTLVGSEPPPELQALAGQDGVEVTGTVDDVRPFYSKAIAAVVPLRTGSGTRLKILEAMAARVPVISTTLGAEGIDVLPGRNILIADREPEWLAAIDMLAAAEAWSSIAQSGRELVERRYDWEMLGEQLHRTYAQWASPGASAPAGSGAYPDGG